LRKKRRGVGNERVEEYDWRREGRVGHHARKEVIKFYV